MDGRIGRGSPGVAAGGRDVVAGGVELLENTSDVVFDGTNGQGQGLGDVLVGGAVGEEFGQQGCRDDPAAHDQNSEAGIGKFRN